MKKPLVLTPGKRYKTAGGWTCEVVRKLKSPLEWNVVVIHDEQCPFEYEDSLLHAEDGRFSRNPTSAWNIVEEI